MSERFAAAARLLPDYLGQHVLLSAAALSLGFLISLPLVVAASRNARIRWPVLGFASIVQTVPSLALLALFYPLLLAISAGWKQLFGHGFSALGFLPSLLALTLYSMLPILRNGVTGLTNVDPAVIEAARGVGMTNRQRLLRIELPLAAPVLMAGVRTAAVWVIGGATLSTPVGQTSLGNYIFAGLQVEDWVSVLFGCLAAVALALIADQLLGLIEVGVATRRPRIAWLGLAILAVGVGAAGAGSLAAAGPPAYVVGAKNFAEQYILADVMTDRIRKQGSAATARVDLGSVIAFRALASNGIDAYVDYSGTVWSTVMNRHDSLPRQEMLQEMKTELARRTAWCCWERSDSRMPTRLRCAAIARSLSASAALRTCRNTRRSCASAGTSSFLPGRNGERCATSMACAFARSVSSNRHFCTRLLHPTRWM